MRHFLLILLIVLLPLRGFAGVGMQTRMDVNALHHAAMASVDGDEGSAAADGACCGQCSACEVCHLQVGQASAPALFLLSLQPARPPVADIRFASAYVRSAHKPPLSRL